MTIIEKKILPKYFELIWQEKKTFEIRLADFKIKEEIEKHGLWVVRFETSYV